MPRSSYVRRIAAILAIPAAAAPAVAPAQSPSPTKVLFACYVPSSGTVYRIREPELKQECTKSSHVPFSWTDGAPALRQVVRVEGPVSTVLANTNGFATASCPAGSQVVGGGYTFILFSDRALPVLFASDRLNVPEPAWEVRIHNSAPGAVDVKFRAVAYCLR